MTDIKVVQYRRAENYAVSWKQDDSLKMVDVDVIYERDKPARFVLSHKAEIDVGQVRALLEVLRRIGFDLGGERE